VVFRIDRAFRSVLDAATTLERFRGWKVGLRSYSEPWLDTTSPFGEALYYITAAYAQLERGILSERVRAGMQRARKQGQHIGRPHAVNGEWPDYRARLLSGELTQEQAASALGVSRSTICRLLQKGGRTSAPLARA
jgi:DNA invertase Pin-like site-specific DNA recombinase